MDHHALGIPESPQAFQPSTPIRVPWVESSKLSFTADISRLALYNAFNVELLQYEFQPYDRRYSVRHLLVAVIGTLLLSGSTFAEAITPGSYYVTASVLNERLAPHPNAKISNRLYHQHRVDVFEVKNGWARVSKYYDGTLEGLQGQVARWVSAKHLSSNRPADLPQQKLSSDPRIQGIPKVDQGGLTKQDVLILYRAAAHYLDTGQCKHIEYGDKSVSKANTYYLNCGGHRNLFFTAADLPKN